MQHPASLPSQSLQRTYPTDMINQFRVPHSKTTNNSQTLFSGTPSAIRLICLYALSEHLSHPALKKKWQTQNQTPHSETEDHRGYQKKKPQSAEKIYDKVKFKHTHKLCWTHVIRDAKSGEPTFRRSGWSGTISRPIRLKWISADAYTRIILTNEMTLLPRQMSFNHQ